MDHHKGRYTLTRGTALVNGLHGLQSDREQEYAPGDQVTPWASCETFYRTVPANGRIRLSTEHAARMVCGVSAYVAPEVINTPDGAGVISSSPFPVFLTLVEFGTMEPRLKNVPLPRLSSWYAGMDQAAYGLPRLGLFGQGMRLAYGPAIDPAASYLLNGFRTPFTVALTLFYRDTL